MIEIKNKAECVGCTACASICPKTAITMVVDREGFLYPKIDIKSCVQCGLCERACPISIVRKEIKTPVAYAAKSRDEKILMKSSSGGIFYHLAKKVLNLGGIVYGASVTEDGTVQHVCVENITDIELLMGSKYVQSNLSNIYLEIKKRLQENQMVMFVGTPCQVEGLHSYLGKECNSLITIDFVCHGVASPKVFKEYIDYLEVRFNKKIKAISFRDKKISWRDYSFAVKFDDLSEWGEEFRENIYLRGFLDNLYLRPSCYQCHFKTTNRISDITLADFWGIQYVNPDFYCNRGVSLCCINSQIGQLLFDNISNEVIFESVNFEDAINHNSAYTKSAKSNQMRRWFFEHLENTPIERNISNSLSPNIITRILLKINKNKFGE